MKEIERRVMKIETMIKQKYEQTNPAYEDMTEEEMNRIVYEVLNGPVQALFAHTRKGFVDVYRLPEEELEKVYREYADGARQLFTLDELKEMGHEPADDYDEYVG